MNKTAMGSILLVIGAVILIVVYSLRPPSGFGDALMMLGQGRENFIREPLYQILLGVGGVVALFGAFQVFLGLQAKKDVET